MVCTHLGYCNGADAAQADTHCLLVTSIRFWRLQRRLVGFQQLLHVSLFRIAIVAAKRPANHDRSAT